MAGGRPGKARSRPAGDLLHGGFLLQDVQHPVAGGKGVLQRAAQAGQRHRRAKGAHQRHGGHQHAVKAHRLPAHQPGGRKQHGQVEQQDDGVRHRRVPARRALHARLIGGERVGPRVHLLQAFPAPAVLERFGEPAQAVEHEAAERAGAGAEFHPVVAARLRNEERHEHADRDIGRKRQQAERRVEAADENAQHRRKQQRNGRRRDRVRVKDLQKLDVRGDDRDQVPLVAPLELCRAEPAQRAEHLVPDQREQLERNEVVARLLRIAQDAAQQRKNDGAGEDRRKRQRHFEAQDSQHGIAAEHRDRRRAQVAGQPHQNREHHEAGERLHKADELQHHLHSASSLHLTPPPFRSFQGSAGLSTALRTARR